MRKINPRPTLQPGRGVSSARRPRLASWGADHRVPHQKSAHTSTNSAQELSTRKLLNSNFRPDPHFVLQLFGEYWGGQSRTKSSRQKNTQHFYHAQCACRAIDGLFRQSASQHTLPIFSESDLTKAYPRLRTKSSRQTSTTNPRVIDSHLLVNGHLPKTLPT